MIYLILQNFIVPQVFLTPNTMPSQAPLAKPLFFNYAVFLNNAHSKNQIVSQNADLNAFMFAAVLTPNQSFRYTENPVPALPKGGALLSLIGCGFCGSDLDKVLNQKSPPGSVLGHEVVGTVQSLCPTYSGPLKIGDRVACAHHVPCQHCHYCQNGSESMCRDFKQSNFAPGGFAQIVALSAGHLAHTVFKVPDEVSSEAASCIEPLACVVQAVQKTRNPNSQKLPPYIAVIGLGFIGLLASQCYQLEGSTVFGLDIQPDRVQMAQEEKLLNSAVNSQTDWETLQATLAKTSPTGKVDTVFLTVVNPATLNQALSLVRDGGSIVLFTSPTRPKEGQPITTLDPNTLYFREITVIPSYSPSLASLQKARDLIFERQINLTPLTTHRVSLENINEGMHAYQKGEALKVFIENQPSLTLYERKESLT
jgi:L-iditol 2-dehydrogenase